MDWGWPQWVMASLYAIAVLAGAFFHKQPKTGEYNVLATIFGSALGAYILHAGGFW